MVQKAKQKDNSTLSSKVLLRKNLLREIPSPIVMETHGGLGRIFDACYRGIANGVVFEKDPDKAVVLGKQRPTWAVYECDCIEALRAGVGAHLAVNFLDVDPYGDPWPVIEAFLGSKRELPGRLGIAVNDGLRQYAKRGHGWASGSLADMAVKYSNDALYDRYVEVCQELLTQKAGQRGYTLTRWAGYCCSPDIAHYAAVLEQ